MESLKKIKQMHEEYILFCEYALSLQKEMSPVTDEICAYDMNDIFNDLQYKINLSRDRIYVINKKIEATCDHEMIVDYIDLDPDTTKKINCCKHCGLTL